MRFFDNNIFSNPGNPIKPIYKPIVEKDGSVVLIIDGYENTDEIIQSYEESVNIDAIIARYMNGDLDALNQRVGKFGDFTEFPKTYAEVLQMRIDAESVFKQLPPELRTRFDNDPDKFFAQSGTEEWFSKLEPIFKFNEKQQKKVESEVKIEE